MSRKPYTYRRAYVRNAGYSKSFLRGHTRIWPRYQIAYGAGVPAEAISQMSEAIGATYHTYTAARLIAKAVNDYAAIIRKRKP